MNAHRLLKTFTFTAILYMASFLIASGAQAETAPPIPPSKTKTLGLHQQRLLAAQEKQKQLKSKSDAQKKELNQTKEKLIQLSRDIQDNEGSLETLESEIRILRTEKSILDDKFDKDRRTIADLVLVLERIRRVPPEAMIARPGKPLQTAQTVMLLKDIVPTINRRAQNLKSDLDHLNSVEVDLARKKSALTTRSTALSIDQKNLKELLKKRENLFASTQKNLTLSKTRLQKISKEAKTLKDLVNKLEQENKRQRTASLAKKAVVATQAKQKSGRYSGQSVPSHAQLPVSGIIRVGYDQKDKFGADSKGLTIDGRSGGLITAPMGGIIRFAGHFKKYGNIIIIEHTGGYHSLISGFGEILTQVGQNVQAGEPLGTLKKAVNGSKASLYYELRYHGKPVNPARKITDLG